MSELVKQSLTNLPQTPYSKGEVIFIEGKADMPQPTDSDRNPENTGSPAPWQEKPVSQDVIKKALELPNLPVEVRGHLENIARETGVPSVSSGTQKSEEQTDEIGSADSVIKAQDEWLEYNQGRELTLGERMRQCFLRSHGLGPNKPVPREIEGKWKHFLARQIVHDPALRTRYAEQVSEVGQSLPEQEALKKQQGEYHGVVAYGQLNTIDITGVSDQELLETAGRFNRRLGRGLIDLTEIDQAVHGLEQGLRNTGLSQNDRVWATNVINQLEGEIATSRRNQEQAQRTREARAGREYLRQRLEINFPVEVLIKDREERNDFFNDLFAGVDSVPHEFFQSAFNPLTRGMRFEYFMDLIRDASVGKIEGWDEIINGLSTQEVKDFQTELAEDFLRYQTERRMRQTLHDVNAALYLASINGEQLWDHMQNFGSDLGDVAFKTAGVRQMMDIYEQAIRESMAENDGYLKPEAILGKVERDSQGKPIVVISKGEIEERTKARFNERNEQDKIFVKNEEGKPVALEKLASWEVDRVFSIAQGMMITTERLISLDAESKLPKGSFSSLFGQDILQQYSSYVHLLGKYGIGGKDLAAYLYKHEEGPLGFFRRWDASQLKEVLKRFEDSPSKFLNEPHEGDDLRYLMLRNPNRAGDIFTWLSWRAQERPDAVSMTEDFLKKGQEKMRARMALRPLGVSEEDYLNEYANWIGTGLRLERMRTDLSRSEEEVGKLPKKTRDEVTERRKKAKDIIKQMARIQPHRLYLASPKIRDRINRVLEPAGNGKLNEAEQQEVAQILNNLSIAEGELLADREVLLEDGKVFADLSLGNYINRVAAGNDNRIGITAAQSIENEQKRRLSREFAAIVLNDYRNNKEKYFDELASYRREFEHGFVLWSGDAPVDEFNVSALGPSAGFARRARDNKAQSEAITEEIKLLTNLKNLKHPDEIITQLAVIHGKIVSYDEGKAKQAIAEKAEGIAKFYAADFLTNIPIVGMVMKQMGRGSFAQIAYDDKSAAVWGAHETNYFFTRLKQKNLITKEQYDILKEKAFAGKADVAIDIGVTMGQFMALALALYLAEKLLKDKQQ